MQTAVQRVAVCTLFCTAFVVLSAASATAAAAAPATRPSVSAFASAAALRTRLTPHPRLLLTAPGLDALAARIHGDDRLERVKARLMRSADFVLTLPPLKHDLVGGRLLAVSRDAVYRLPTLALAYRLSSERRYLDGARETMRTIVGFPDFNPGNSLDVAEMTLALAVGYDWLFADLPPAERDAVRQAILDKGVRTSFDPKNRPEFWTRASHNWNQVCHGGMTLGALAVAEDEPDLARRVIDRAIDGLPYAMKQYAPDGNYPEGASYWGYGTTYNLMLIAALESAVGDSFGLADQPGFLASADYHLHLIGPTGLMFSYSDSRENIPGPSPAAFGLAARRGDPSLLFNDLKRLDQRLDEPPLVKEHIAADWLLLVWAGKGLKKVTPRTTHYAGRGVTPVAMHRSSWTPDATYVGLKGGSPGTNHAHMDVGAFVLDADGVRWATDLGMQDYFSLESRKVDLWNARQGAQRWKVYRIGPIPHNILTVDGQEQVVSANAPLMRSTETFSVVDTTPVYAGQLSAAARGVMLRPDRSVRVQDEIRVETPATTGPAATGPAGPSAGPRKIRWAMLTNADITLHDGPTATLTRDGKRLEVRVVSPAGARLVIESTDPPRDYDAANPGTRLLTFQTTLAAGEAATLAVDFLPEAARTSAEPVVPLTAWR